MLKTNSNNIRTSTCTYLFVPSGDITMCWSLAISLNICQRAKADKHSQFGRVKTHIIGNDEKLRLKCNFYKIFTYSSLLNMLCILL